MTAANREEYVRLALQHMLYARVADEMAAFLKGLVDVLKVRRPALAQRK